MAKKRPTEAGWDSDEDALLGDTAGGVSVFSKKEDESIDEDALLGIKVDTSIQDKSAGDGYELLLDDCGVTGFDITADNQELDYEDQDEEDGDASQDAEPLVVDEVPNNTTCVAQAVKTQVGSKKETAESDSDSEEDKKNRERFKTERQTINLKPFKKSTPDIPESLEVTKEMQAEIDTFEKQKGRKSKQQQQRRGQQQFQQNRPRFNRGGHHNNFGPRGPMPRGRFPGPGNPRGMRPPGDFNMRPNNGHPPGPRPAGPNFDQGPPRGSFPYPHEIVGQRPPQPPPSNHAPHPQQQHPPHMPGPGQPIHSSPHPGPPQGQPQAIHINPKFQGPLPVDLAQQQQQQQHHHQPPQPGPPQPLFSQPQPHFPGSQPSWSPSPQQPPHQSPHQPPHHQPQQPPHQPHVSSAPPVSFHQPRPLMPPRPGLEAQQPGILGSPPSQFLPPRGHLEAPRPGFGPPQRPPGHGDMFPGPGGQQRPGFPPNSMNLHGPAAPQQFHNRPPAPHMRGPPPGNVQQQRPPHQHPQTPQRPPPRPLLPPGQFRQQNPQGGGNQPQRFQGPVRGQHPQGFNPSPQDLMSINTHGNAPQQQQPAQPDPATLAKRREQEEKMKKRRERFESNAPVNSNLKVLTSSSSTKVAIKRPSMDAAPDNMAQPKIQRLEEAVPMNDDEQLQRALEEQKHRREQIQRMKENKRQQEASVRRQNLIQKIAKEGKTLKDLEPSSANQQIQPVQNTFGPTQQQNQFTPQNQQVQQSQQNAQQQQQWHSPNQGRGRGAVGRGNFGRGNAGRGNIGQVNMGRGNFGRGGMNRGNKTMSNQGQPISVLGQSPQQGQGHQTFEGQDRGQANARGQGQANVRGRGQRGRGRGRGGQVPQANPNIREIELSDPVNVAPSSARTVLPVSEVNAAGAANQGGQAGRANQGQTGRTVVAHVPSPAKRTVLAGNTAQRRIVMDSNVGAATTCSISIEGLPANPDLGRINILCSTAGDVKNFNYKADERKVVVRFANQTQAQNFLKKYNRSMLDLTVITVRSIPDF